VRKRCFKNGVSTALKVQLEESAVARAQEATDTQRLEQRRVNLLANVTHRVVAEAAEAKAQAAAQLGFDVKQQAKELQLTVRKRTLFVTFLTIKAPTISNSLGTSAGKKVRG
jgi:serine protease inhibitor